VTALDVWYVGDPGRGLEAVGFLEEHTERQVRLVAVRPAGLEPALEDGGADAVLVGGGLDEEGRDRVAEALAAAETPAPVFDLGDGTVSVPDGIEYHDLYPGTDPDEAAAHVLSTVEGEETGASTAPGSGEWTRPVYQGTDEYFTLDPERRVTAWDPGLAEWTGAGVADAVGRSVEEMFPPAQQEGFRSLCDRVAESGEADTAEFSTAAGDWLCVRVAPDGRGGLRCFVRDVSDRKAYQAEIAATRERFEHTIERITDAFFVLDHDERFVILNSRAESLLGVRGETVVGERFWEIFPSAVNTTFYHGFTRAMDAQQPTSFEVHYEPQDRWFEVNAYPDEDGLSVYMGDITERVRLQHRLESLHERTQRLIVAESAEEIAGNAVEAAADVLGFPLSACWTYDGTRRRLEPLARSKALDERIGGIEPIEPGSGLAWDVYEAGNREVSNALAADTAALHRPDDVGSVLLVPLGECGLLGAYADEEGAFDETDAELFRLLAAAVESAMARADRERELARRNERLDEFASTVSHDLRNPLHVATARVDMARDTGDVEHLEEVSEALDRMETLIEDLLARARGEQDVERQPLSLATAARDAWASLDTGAADLSVEGDGTLQADKNRMAQLFENLFRNAVEHGSTSPRSQAPEDAVEHGGEGVTVRVGPTEDGFYVADDGPGIPEDIREDLFEQGVSGSPDGTGYGLAIVADVVRSHDWTVEAGESTDGGARFEVAHVHSLTEREPA
jgi:PAS domain S-box-containing protein